MSGPADVDLSKLDDNAIAMLDWSLLDPEAGLVDADTVYGPKPEAGAAESEAEPEERAAKGRARLDEILDAARADADNGKRLISAALVDASTIDALAEAYQVAESYCNALLLDTRAVRGLGGHVDQLERAIKKRVKEQRKAPPPPPRTPRTPGGEPGGAPRRTVIVGARTDISDTEALDALATHPDIYWSEAMGLVQADAARGTIKAVSADALPPILSVVADFVQAKVKDGLQVTDAYGEPMYVHVQPPGRLARALAARTSFPGVREVVQVTHVPVVHADGRVTCTKGWDPVSRLLYLPHEDPPPLLDRPTQEDALAARKLLLDAVREFPFQSPADRSAWLALVLTLVCRSAFEGAVPAFVASANQARVGKTRLIQVAEYIAMGRVAAVMPWARDRDNEENRKRVESVVVAGLTLALFDNVRGPIGNEALEAALTATRYRLRILGSNSAPDVPQRTVFAFSANGASYAGDMAGRVLPIRLHVDKANPEQRQFERPDIFAWLHPRRAELLSAALTMVRAYLLAGRPCPRKLPEWGSYEAWSAVVRGAIVWAGGSDPIETRGDVRENDHSSGGHERLVALIYALFHEQPWTIGKLAERLEVDATGDIMLTHEWALSDARSVMAELGAWSRRDKQVDRMAFGRHVLPEHMERPTLDGKRIVRALTADGRPMQTNSKSAQYVVQLREREPGEEG